MQTSLKVGPYEFSKGLINRRSSDGFSIELPSHRSWIQFQNSIRKIVISRSKPIKGHRMIKQVATYLLIVSQKQENKCNEIKRVQAFQKIFLLFLRILTYLTITSMAKSKWFFYKHYGSSFKIVLISKFLAHCATTYSMSSVILLSTLLELSDLNFFLKKPCDNSTIVKRSKNWKRLFSAMKTLEEC